VCWREPHSQVVNPAPQVCKNIFTQVLNAGVAHPLKTENVLQEANHLTLQSLF
jgi:hypothetical protein